MAEAELIGGIRFLHRKKGLAFPPVRLLLDMQLKNNAYNNYYLEY